MKAKNEIVNMRQSIDRLRKQEGRLDLDMWGRGYLAGAQTAIHWVLEIGMDPRKILSIPDFREHVGGER